MIETDSASFSTSERSCAATVKRGNRRPRSSGSRIEMSWAIATSSTPKRTKTCAPGSWSVGSERESIARLNVRRCAFGELDDDLRSPSRCGPPRLQTAHDIQHDKLTIKEDRIDRKTHEEHVDR